MTEVSSGALLLMGNRMVAMKRLVMRVLLATESRLSRRRCVQRTMAPVATRSMMLAIHSVDISLSLSLSLLLLLLLLLPSCSWMFELVREMFAEFRSSGLSTKRWAWEPRLK